MKLPEEPAIGDQGCDLFNILKYIAGWSIIKGEDKAGEETQEQGGQA